LDAVVGTVTGIATVTVTHVVAVVVEVAVV
jgi:hypothetical protein